MSFAGGQKVLRRTLSVGSSASPESPSSPFSRNSSSRSASSFGCSEFPSCIHWCDQIENGQAYEMLHFDFDDMHVKHHFHGECQDSIDHSQDFRVSSSPLRTASVGNSGGEDSPNSDSHLYSHSSSSDVHALPALRRTASALPVLSYALPSESKLDSLIGAFERCKSLKRPDTDRAIHLALRGIELRKHCCERLLKCFCGYDIRVLDLAPKVKFDSDLKSYVHCNSGDCDPNTGNDGIRILLSMLQLGPKKGNKLEQLIIPRCNIGKRGVSELAQSLAVFANLQILEIRENPGVGVHFSVLAQSLQHCSNLKVLNIAACGLGMHGSYVLEAILPRLFQLEELYLTNNYITGPIMERLAPSLEKLTCLRKLFLQQNDLGLIGAKALRKSFQVMQSITMLTLDYCVLRADGLLEIARGLRHLHLMETLRINHNGLGLIKVEDASVKDVCDTLADSLSRMSHLKNVELLQSGFGSQDAMTIAKALLAANSTADVDDKKVKEVLRHLRQENEGLALAAASRADLDGEESQPMRCMLSEVYSHNIVRHLPINRNQCGACQSPRVSIVANFFKGKKGVETRRASFIGEKGTYNSDVVMKTVPYPTSKDKFERKLLDQQLNGLSRVSRDSPLFLELLSISFHYEDNHQSEVGSQPFRECFLSAIVPFCGGGNLCERLWKGLSQMDDGGHMQSVHALHVKDMFQKYHVALSIARALCHCHELDIVHSDLCCCNILLTRDKEKSSESSDDYWLVKIANTGVYPDSDSLDNRRVYLAPELLSQLPIQHPISSSHAHGKSAKSSFIEMSPPHVSPNSPPLHSSPSAGGSGPPITFSKESDVYALGITLLQLFRHTLVDCKDEMCAVAASQTPSTLTIPLIPKHFATTLFPPLPTSLQSIISSCTMRNPDDRPSAAEISQLLESAIENCNARQGGVSEHSFDWLLLQ